MVLPDILSPHPDNNSLYIHIPFCSFKCDYCDFYSVPNATVNLQKQVVEKILDEVSRYIDYLSVTTIETVYIGGGTPSVLNDDIFAMLMKGLSRRLPGKIAEWTIEANPESIRPGFLETAQSFGANRLSIGIQSFEDRLLEMLGRKARSADINRALAMIGNIWAGNLTGDIITGIPGQTDMDAPGDARRLLELGFNHYSVYTLTVEEGTPMYRSANAGRVQLVPGKEADRYWFEVLALLEQNGFVHYEISNLSRPGFESRHNLRYWNMQPYIGVGPSAVSTMPGTSGRVVRMQNPRSLPDYLGQDHGGTCPEYEIVSPKEFLLENLMMGFRLKSGIEKAVFCSRFGEPLDEIMSGLWESWIYKGFAEEDASHWKLTQHGRFILNSLLLDIAGLVSDTETIELLRWN